MDGNILESRVNEVVNLYLNLPKFALANLKKLMNVSHSNKLDEHLSFELTLALLSTLSNDFSKGVRAAISGDKPEFD